MAQGTHPNSKVSIPPFKINSRQEMARIINDYDWAKTSIGAMDSWPQSLKTSLSIILTSKFPMFLFWGSDLICFYNDAYRPSLGNDGKHPDAVGKPGEEVWPEIWAFIKPIIDQVMSGGEASWYEDQYLPIYRNGKIEDVYWTFSYSPVYVESGTPGGVFVTCTETTGKVQTMKELTLSNERFQNLLQQTTIGIIVLMGEEMRVAMVNETYGELIGRTAGELENKCLFSIIPEAEEVFRPIIDGVRLSGESLYLYSQPYAVFINGEKKEGLLNLVYHPFKEAGGTISGVIVHCHDVTREALITKSLKESEQEAQKLAKELASAIEELRASNEEITATNDELTTLNDRLIKVNSDMDNFIYTASHDLKAPILNIEGLITALSKNLNKENLENPIIHRLLSMIRASIERFKKTLLDLTEISKLQRITAEEETKINLVQLINELKLDLADTIEASHGLIQLKATIKEVTFSYKNLRSILYNLISNALKYKSLERNALIVITATENEDFNIIAVSDNGLGMDLSKSDFIFGMFKRLHNHVEGSGVGLFIVKKIVDNAGGKIEVESEINKGSTFRIYLRK